MKRVSKRTFNWTILCVHNGFVLKYPYYDRYNEGFYAAEKVFTSWDELIKALELSKVTVMSIADENARAIENIVEGRAVR